MAERRGAVPYVPEKITVHLGAPGESAPDVTVTFTDYIKNVASSEIYPTWSTAAIRANILAQISYALNKVYLEYYRSRGYRFDITNDTAFDQSFVYGRTFFRNISEIVDDIFDNYIRRKGFVEPLAAKYCNGTTSVCDGMSQWGSEDLGAGGYDSVEILKYYYGDNIEIVADAPVRADRESYPGSPLGRGSRGADVKRIQAELNLISRNYPLIPKVPAVDGIYGSATEESVKVFQRIFGLNDDGIVGRSTWYKLVQIYTGILQLAELRSEGQRYTEDFFSYDDIVYPGDEGEKVSALQYLLNVISAYYPVIPEIPEAESGTYGPYTGNSVKKAQAAFGLSQDGIVGEDTWFAIYDAYKGVKSAMENR